MAGLNSIMKIFLPKDRVFYQLFESVAEELVKMGEKLKDVVNEPDFDRRKHIVFLHRHEHQRFYRSIRGQNKDWPCFTGFESEDGNDA
jgi:hypothetical protein